MSFLRPCPDCERHVGADEASCPFCFAALPSAGPAPNIPTARLGRAALMAFGMLAAGTGLVGCIGSPAYGAPPDDSGVVGDAGVDSGGPAPAYGAPAP